MYDTATTFEEILVSKNPAISAKEQYSNWAMFGNVVTDYTPAFARATSALLI